MKLVIKESKKFKLDTQPNIVFQYDNLYGLGISIYDVSVFNPSIVLTKQQVERLIKFLQKTVKEM